MNNSHYILEGGSFPVPNAIIKKGTIEEMYASIKQAILDESAQEVECIEGLEDVVKYTTNIVYVLNVTQDGHKYEYTLTPAWEY